MTEDRFAKIRHTISLFSNQTDGDTNTTTGIYKRLTRQEILAIECLKPQFQNPCLPLQRRKCTKKKNGAWKMISCQASTLKSLLLSNDNEDNYFRDKCNCQEKRLQKKFLKKHVVTSQRLRHNNKFIRNKRSILGEDPEVLKEMAAEEIDEVDTIMEDITDEIKDLQQSIIPCSVNNKQVHCNESVYTDKVTWRTSR